MHESYYQGFKSKCVVVEVAVKWKELSADYPQLDQQRCT